MKRTSIALLALASACTFVDSAVSGASDQAGRNIGSRMVGSSGAGAPSGAGGMSAATMNPAFMNLYMTTIFTYAFSAGGYDIGQDAYKAGQFTRWQGKSDNGKGIQLERAPLFDDAQGRQWWKVKWTDEEGKTTILEGLLDPQQQKFV